MIPAFRGSLHHLALGSPDPAALAAFYRDPDGNVVVFGLPGEAPADCNDATLRDRRRHTHQFTPLNPGDVIAMGTPGGVGFKREPQVFMKPGDRIEVAIEGIGHLLNPVSDEVAG